MLNVNVLILGVIVAIIFFEITNISPGGIIVPGILVVYFNQLERIGFTLIVAVLTYLVVKLLSKYCVIFGKRRFALCIIISIFVNLILSLIFKNFDIAILSSTLIGYTIAGLIANDCYKQGLVKTIPSLLICVGIIECIMLVINNI